MPDADPGYDMGRFMEYDTPYAILRVRHKRQGEHDFKRLPAPSHGFASGGSHA